MKRMWFVVLVCLYVMPVFGATKKIPFNATVYVSPMDGFETFIAAALQAKQVPVTVVADREKAIYELRGNSESNKPGWAKTIFTGQTRSDEQASVSLIKIDTSEVIFAYSVNKRAAFRGKQSAAESCAKHLKDYVDIPKR